MSRHPKIGASQRRNGGLWRLTATVAPRLTSHHPAVSHHPAHRQTQGKMVALQRIHSQQTPTTTSHASPIQVV